MQVSEVTAAVVTRRPVAQVLAESRRLVEPVYRSVADRFPAEVRTIVGYHAGWWDADGQATQDAGKAVRPALALACARAITPPEPTGHTELSQAIVRTAVAVELVHDFSLLHDDVMDGDLIRRHRPAAWAVFGVGPAILAGDVLLTAAVQQASTAEMVKVMAVAVQELCAGQAADLAFEDRDDVSLAECVAMAQGKTGALLGAACQLGAMAAGASRKPRTATAGLAGSSVWPSSSSMIFWVFGVTRG